MTSIHIQSMIAKSTSTLSATTSFIPRAIKSKNTTIQFVPGPCYRSAFPIFTL